MRGGNALAGCGKEVWRGCDDQSAVGTLGRVAVALGDGRRLTATITLHVMKERE